jgi:hypothetical protein
MMPEINLSTLHTIHNELSPILDRIEVLIAVSLETIGDSAERQHRASVLLDVLESEAAHLREGFDRLCCAYTRDPHP